MTSKGNSTLKRKVEREIQEESIGVKKLLETLITSFLRSDSDYGEITDLKIDINRIYRLVRNYINREKIDVYALKLEDRILLSRTNIGFEELYEIIKGKSSLEMKKNMTEIWNDAENKIIHLIIIPFRKHFPIEYQNEREKIKMIEKFLSMKL